MTPGAAVLISGQQLLNLNGVAVVWGTDAGKIQQVTDFGTTHGIYGVGDVFKLANGQQYQFVGSGAFGLVGGGFDTGQFSWANFLTFHDMNDAFVNQVMTNPNLMPPVLKDALDWVYTYRPDLRLNGGIAQVANKYGGAAGYAYAVSWVGNSEEKSDPIGYAVRHYGFTPPAGYSQPVTGEGGAIIATGGTVTVPAGGGSTVTTTPASGGTVTTTTPLTTASAQAFIKQNPAVVIGLGVAGLVLLTGRK